MLTVSRRKEESWFGIDEGPLKVTLQAFVSRRHILNNLKT